MLFKLLRTIHARPVATSLVLAVVLGLTWLITGVVRADRQEDAIRRMQASGAAIKFLHETEAEGRLGEYIFSKPAPPGNPFLHRLLGEHFFLRVDRVTFPFGATDEDVKPIWDVPAVTDLGLRGARVSNDVISRLSELPKLFALDLSSTQVTDADLLSLEKLPCLEVLFLENTSVSDDAVPSLIAMHNLNGIYVRNTRITKQGYMRLVQERSELGVDWCPPFPETHRHTCARLEQNGARIVVNGEGTEASCAVLFHGNDIDRAILQDMAKLSSVTKLLFDNVAFADGVFEHFDCPKELETLDLSGSNVRNEDLCLLATKHLLSRQLILSRTEISDAGLSCLPKDAKLTELDLAATKISNRGLKHVGLLQGLKYLSLQDTAVTGAGLRHLNDLRNLETLNLIDTNVSDAAVAELRRALPKCVIEQRLRKER